MGGNGATAFGKMALSWMTLQKAALMNNPLQFDTKRRRDSQYYDSQYIDTQHKGLVCASQTKWHWAQPSLSVTMLYIMLAVIMLNITFHSWLCWVSLCRVSLCWVSLCKMDINRMTCSRVTFIRTTIIGTTFIRTTYNRTPLISGLYYKCLMIVIYDHNDIGLYYKTRDDRNWWSS